MICGAHLQLGCTIVRSWQLSRAWPRGQALGSLYAADHWLFCAAGRNPVQALAAYGAWTQPVPYANEMVSSRSLRSMGPCQCCQAQHELSLLLLSSILGLVVLILTAGMQVS